jgi:hypothetical protein
MQKVDVGQLIALNSVNLLPDGVGLLTMPTVLPFHFSLRVFEAYVPTERQRLWVEQLTPDNSEVDPLFGDVTRVHPPDARAVTAVSISTALTRPSTAALAPYGRPAFRFDDDKRFDCGNTMVRISPRRWRLSQAAGRRM